MNSCMSWFPLYERLRAAMDFYMLREIRNYSEETDFANMINCNLNVESPLSYFCHVSDAQRFYFKLLSLIVFQESR